MTELFSNLGQTSINQIGGIGATDTTVVVASLNGTNPANAFPSSGNFRLVFGNDLNSEIALCTAVNSITNTFTIVRGQEGTTAQAWVNGTPVALILTAQSINQMRAEVFSAGPYSARPTQGLPTGSYYQTTDGHTPWVWDPFVGAWRPQINGVLGYQPPVSTIFTALNSPASLIDTAHGALQYTGGSDGANTTTLRGYTAPFTGPGFVEAAFSVQANLINAANTWFGLGIFFRESSSGKMWSVGYGQNANSLLNYLEVDTWTSTASRTSLNAYGFATDSNVPFFIRARWDKTSTYADISRDGFSWRTVQTNSLASVFTSVPDQIGIGGYTANGTPVLNILSLRFGAYASPIINVVRPPPPIIAPTVYPSVGYINPILNH